MSDALVADRDDALGQPVDRPLIVRTIILQLHDSVEAFRAVSLTQIGVVILEGLRYLRYSVPLEPRPESGHDGADCLASPCFMIDLAARKCKPFLTAIVTLEIAPGAKGNEDSARR